MALKEPLQQNMAAASLESSFKDNGIFINQTPRGFLWELIGCTAKNEYKVSKVSNDWDEILSTSKLSETKSGFPFEILALESSNCLARNWLRESRATVLKVSVGEEIGGSPLVEFHKPCSLPHGCCCMLPEFTTKLPDGTELNRSKMVYSCFAPYAKFEDPIGTDKFVLHPPLCCGGLCIKPECSCNKCATIPFYFFDPATGMQIQPDDKYPPQIRMVRQGMAKACCTTANNFAVNFPQDLTPEQKAGMLGMTLLLDMAVFEKKNQN